MVLFDSCILIDLLRQRPAAVDFIRALREQPHISVVTITELRAGQRSVAEARQIDNVINGCVVHPVSVEIAELAGEFLQSYRRSHAVDIADAMIAATARHHGLELATLNLKHFPMFPHLTAPY